MATRDSNDDGMLSSFVNCIVLSTLYAQSKGITKERNGQMPTVSIFGSEFSLALRDAISYSGSYNEVYTKHIENATEELRGRNILNNVGGPQMHSFPRVPVL